MLPVHDGGLEHFNTSVLAVSSQNHLKLLSVLEDELNQKGNVFFRSIQHVALQCHSVLQQNKMKIDMPCKPSYQVLHTLTSGPL